MPELPDVEVFGSYLKRKVLRKKILDVDVKKAKILKGVSAKQLQKALVGQSFTALERLGKYLFLKLSGGAYVIMHFGMTGHVFIYKEDNPFAAHTCVVWEFANHTKLAYINMRLFGFVSLVESNEPFVKKLGPDALSISKSDFLSLFGKGSLKSILIDQKKIAGIGNVYCDEILFQSRFAPTTQAKSLSDSEVEKLYTKMRAVLKEAIKAKADREQMPKSWLIHFRKKNIPCPRCKSPIRQLKAGGRSTYYCSKCQHAR